MTALTDYLKKSTGFSDSAIAELAISALEFIISSVKRGESIKIEGLGYFKIVDKPERDGRNPRTGEMTIFSASRRAKFVFSKDFTDSIQPDFTIESDTESDAIERNPYEIETLPSFEEFTNIPANLLPESFLNSPPISSISSMPSLLQIPPIPSELLLESEMAMPKPEMVWQIKAPDSSFVEVPTSDLSNWGVTSITPIYSPETGWQLAGKIPELVGIVA